MADHIHKERGDEEEVVEEIPQFKGTLEQLNNLIPAKEMPEAEKDLEEALVSHIQKFLIELGQGFAFVGQQVPIKAGKKDLYIDLLFYHLLWVGESSRFFCYVP